MVTIKTFRELALSFHECVEQPHFEKTSFRVNKKIFATLDETKKLVVLKLSEIDQSVFAAIDPLMIHPVAGAWGKQGWTAVHLPNIKKVLLNDALMSAYRAVAPKKFAELYKQPGDGN